MIMGTGQDLYRRAKTIIPGGTQLLSKRPEFFLPDNWPAYYSRAKGCEVWDLDGVKFLDMSYMGVGSCLVGYADDEIDDAVVAAIRGGNMSTLNAPEEVELAETLCRLHPWAEMVRYARAGGEACAMAIRIARAYSKRDVVLFGGYHGWSDWYLAANLADPSNLNRVHLAGLSPDGVPRALAGTAFPFFYNDVQSFVDLMARHAGKVGAVIIESVRDKSPNKEFSDTLGRLTEEQDVPLIIDEVSAGWRMNVGGAHLIHDIHPDLAVFAKGMSNGYPMSAVIGKRHIMEAAQGSFISSTYWTDRAGPVAALATIRKVEREEIPTHLVSAGRAVKAIWRDKAELQGVAIEVGGIDPIGHFKFVHAEPLVLKTLFTQLMLARGFLATTSFYASFAHKEEHVSAYASAVGEVFAEIARAVEGGDPRRLLEGPVCHSGFQRLT